MNKAARVGLIVIVLVGMGLLMGSSSGGCPWNTEDNKDNVNVGSSGVTPTAPSCLTLSVSSSQIDLFWSGDATNETHFRIERKTAYGGTWLILATVTSNITTYSDAAISPWNVYYYRVQSYNSFGDSDYSNEASTNPSAPSALTLTIASASQLILSWTDTSYGEDGFKIERKTGSAGTYSQIDVVGTNVTTYSDTNVSFGNVYYYRVKAYNSLRESSYSNEANSGISTPSYLNLSIASASQVNLSWGNVYGEDGFKLERKIGIGGTYAEIYSAPSNGTSISDTGVAYGDDYYYRVKAYTAINESSWREATTALAGPSGLSAPTISSIRVSLSWMDLTGETGYQLERKEGELGSYTPISDEIAANVTTYNDDTVISNMDYFYRIKGFHLLNTGSYSYELNAPTPLSGPLNLVAVSDTATTIILTWTDLDGEEGYKIERSLTGGTDAPDWAEITSSVPADQTTYTDDLVTTGTTYYYRIRGYNNEVAGDGEYSNEANATAQE